MLAETDVEIDEVIELTQAQKSFYRENEFIKLKGVFSKETIEYYKEAMFTKVRELNTLHLPMEERNTYQKAFLQVMNLWRHSEAVKEFVFGKKIASIATQLMNVNGVRLYHDQALFKEPNGGITPWHADQQYWPLASDKTITAWVPLQTTDLNMGPLSFAAGSHKVKDFRDLEISDQAEFQIGQAMNQFEVICEAFELGEVSFHSGWMYHNAQGNNSDRMRGAMTVIYMDKDMRMKEPESQNQVNDRNTWLSGVGIGEICAGELNPIVFEKR